MVSTANSASRRKKSAWDTIGGVDGARDQLIDAIVTPLRHPHAVSRLGIRPAKGFLLYGPPGVGKALLVRATAEASGARLIELSAPDILALGPDGGEKVLRDAFASARNGAPSLIFLNELDLLAPARIANSTEPQRNEQIVNLLLAELDRLYHGAAVIVVGSTSRPNVIEPALLRPGRLDELIYVPIPDDQGRATVLTIQLAKVPLAADVTINSLAERSARFTPADIEDLIRRAGLHALKQKPAARRLAMADFEAALAVTRATVTETMEKEYEKLQGEIKQNAMKLEPMGFFAPGQLKPVRDSKHGA